MPSAASPVTISAVPMLFSACTRISAASGPAGRRSSSSMVNPTQCRQPVRSESSIRSWDMLLYAIASETDSLPASASTASWPCRSASSLRAANQCSRDSQRCVSPTRTRSPSSVQIRSASPRAASASSMWSVR